MSKPSSADESAPTQLPLQPVHETASSADQHTAGLLSSGGGDNDALDFLAKAEAADELGRLAHYRVLKELGRGGMGCVLLAEDTKLQRQVALKVMLPQFARDAKAKERFLREARAAARIKHDNVITIFQVDEANGVPFIALEYLQGAPLDKYLKDKGSLPLAIAVRVAREMAEGLSAAHKQGLVHRDIKPGNIWLEAIGERGASTLRFRVRILDFGLARADKDDTHLTQSGAIVGTPAFMAPEQARGEKIDGRCDLFSLGVVLYRMTTGQQPFAGPTTIAILTAIALDTPVAARSINPNIPEALEKVIMKLLEKDAGQRYPSAKELIADLNGVLKEMAQATKVEVATEAFVPAAAARTPVAKRAKQPVTAPAGGGSKRGLKILIAVALGFFALSILAWQIVIRITDHKGNVREVEVKKNEKLEIIPRPDPPDLVNPPIVPLTLQEKEAKKLQADWAAKLKLPVEATNKIGMNLILIPPAGAALPKAYYLGKYEVTQGEWEKVMGYNPSNFDAKNVKVTGMDTSVIPVDRVSWYDSVEFCNKLSELEGMKPYYELTVRKRAGKAIDEAEVKILGGVGYHIPTDAEWEHGCRAGTKTKYHFGDKDEDLLEYAWFKENSGGRTHVVGQKKPNGFGLYDMHGNVREWNEEMLKADTAASECVHRGGSWIAPAGSCAVSSRLRNPLANRYYTLGLRVARVPSSEAAVNPPFVPLTLEEKETQKLQADWAAKLKLPVEAVNKIGMKLILIPPAGAALPKAYYLGKYEVTQKEWEQVMDYNPSNFSAKGGGTGGGAKKVAGLDTSSFPVERVTWFDSVEYCNKLSEREGMKPYYELTVKKRDDQSIAEAEVKIVGGAGYHIPTDAEWEHGCRAWTKTKYHCGDRDEDLLEYAWFKDNSDGRTHAVGEKKPNAFGLYDMHGNVREWNEEMLTKADTGAPERVSRGGHWNYPAGACAVSSRYRSTPAHRIYYLGLRLSRVP